MHIVIYFWSPYKTKSSMNKLLMRNITMTKKLFIWSKDLGLCWTPTTIHIRRPLLSTLTHLYFATRFIHCLFSLATLLILGFPLAIFLCLFIWKFFHPHLFTLLWMSTISSTGYCCSLSYCSIMAMVSKSSTSSKYSSSIS